MCERNIDQLPFPHPQLGTWLTTQACALTGDLTNDLFSQAGTQTTELHQPGLAVVLINVKSINYP